MPTPKSIKASFRKDDRAALFNLKPIRKQIEQAIKEVTRWKPLRKHNFVTSTVKKVRNQFIEVTIRVNRSTRPENGGIHPPRFIWLDK